jgi:hypothetical protein
MRHIRHDTRFHVFVPTYQWNGYSDINMFIDDATLKIRALGYLFARLAGSRDAH